MQSRRSEPHTAMDLQLSQVPLPKSHHKEHGHPLPHHEGTRTGTSKPLCWRFGKGQGGKPFSFPLSVRDGDSQSGGCTTSTPSRHFKLLVRDSRKRERWQLKHAQPGTSLRRVVESPLLSPSVGCNSCHRSCNEPWTTPISAVG